MATSIQEILADEKLKHYVVPQDVPVVKLDVANAFNALTDKEKLYAHYISEASWAGTPVVLEQCSNEAPKIFRLLLILFKSLFDGAASKSVADLAKYAAVSEDAMNNLLQFSSQFLGNMGNYRSFGDDKFIPRLSQDDFAAIVAASKNGAAQSLFNEIKDVIYSLKEDNMEFGFASSPSQKTCSGYYSSNVSKDDAVLVGKFLQEKQIASGINSRLFKLSDKEFEVKVASAQAIDFGTFDFEGVKIHVKGGDFAAEMQSVADNLSKAMTFSANDNQTEMLKKYVKHFLAGDIKDHEDSQRWWIKDKGPVVETNIGFIESYRDPLHLRAEWEGFVAVVNKEMSAKFNSLVENAESFIKLLPWNLQSGDFEKDKFHRPDFTSLEVLTFASSGIPAGINIPNYDNIRQEEGFKNVSLGNVLNASNPKEEITFILEKDKELFTKYRGKSFEVQVGIHELLGHGTGKLLARDDKGTLNFDAEKVINPVTKSKIETFYLPGETYYSKFASIASSYEECRAESVGIFLSVYDDILKIFGYTGEEAKTVTYINWLIMCRAGILALEFYNPDSKKWLQAHMQARFAILRVLLEAGNGFVELKKENDNVVVTMDADKIKTVGMPAMHDFLLKLNIFKATADVEAAGQLYAKYTAVDQAFIELRREVLAKKKPRRVFVQSRTIVEADNKVKLIEYEPSAVGLIQSFLDRFPQKE